MAFKDLFKKQPAPGPQIVQAEKKSAKKEPEQKEIFEFSFNEHRFGHKDGVCIMAYPTPKSLYGFFEYVTEEITPAEYEMWKDSLVHPELYIITAENLGRGMQKYTIALKDKE